MHTTYIVLCSRIVYLCMYVGTYAGLTYVVTSMWQYVIAITEVQLTYIVTYVVAPYMQIIVRA